MRKGEIACYKQFLLFSLFSTVIYLTLVKRSRQIKVAMDLVQILGFADHKLNVIQNIRFVFQQRILAEKRRKCWSPAFSPFPTMFSTQSKTKLVFKQPSLVAQSVALRT